MPYKSNSQRRWAHTRSGLKALGGKAKVAEWDAASKGKRLPEKVKPKKKKKSGSGDKRIKGGYY